MLSAKKQGLRPREFSLRIEEVRHLERLAAYRRFADLRAQSGTRTRFKSPLREKRHQAVGKL